MHCSCVGNSWDVEEIFLVTLGALLQPGPDCDKFLFDCIADTNLTCSYNLVGSRKCNSLVYVISEELVVG